MGKQFDSNYEKKERLKKLIEICELSYLGFEVFLDYESEGKYIYAIFNGNKPLSKLFQTRIDKCFGLKKGTFEDLSRELDLYKIKKVISKFKKANPNNPGYFVQEDPSVLIIKDLIRQDYFSKKRTVKEIVEKCAQLGYSYSSDFLTQKLINLVRKRYLKSEKQFVMLKNGKKGRKKVNVYWA